MKRVGKVKFFIALILLLAFTYVTFFGVSFDNYYGDKNTFHFGIKSASEIRWGIDISGGVEAVFTPEIDEDKISEADMDAAKKIVETRLVNHNITDYEVFVDYDQHHVVVRFPQGASKDEQFDPQEVVNEIGQMANLRFYKDTPDAETVKSNPDSLKSSLVLTGDDVDDAQAGYDQQTNEPIVFLSLKSSGKAKFASATKEQMGKQISIWMDDLMISAPTVQAEINDGKAQITGMESYEAAKELADNINAGALPFAVSADSSKLQIIAPTLGSDALQVMVIAAVIAFAIICLIMLFKYRLPGFIACITLMGQAAVMVAAASGFFDTWESFTLTVPGIAGMILSIGMGVDSNVITSERIREELANGKTLDSAIDKGYSNAFSAILDGNVTNVLVAIVLMGAFGTTDGIFYKLFSWVLGFFTSSIAGSIYSFGYTLIVGVIANFIMAVFWSKILLKGIARFKAFRKPWLYGGAK